MKKLIPIITLCLCLFFTDPVYAESYSTVTSGYTADGIYYGAITLDILASLADADSITITQEFTFSGTVIPGTSIDWRDTINGTVYIGTLYLYSYYHFENTTVAIYKGTLYKENTSL